MTYPNWHTAEYIQRDLHGEMRLLCLFHIRQSGAILRFAYKNPTVLLQRLKRRISLITEFNPKVRVYCLAVRDFGGDLLSRWTYRTHVDGRGTVHQGKAVL